MTRIRVIGAGILAINLFAAGSAGAQTAPSRGFVGGGLDLLSDSALNVTRTTDPAPLPLAWFVEGGPSSVGRSRLARNCFVGPDRRRRIPAPRER